MNAELEEGVPYILMDHIRLPPSGENDSISGLTERKMVSGDMIWYKNSVHMRDLLPHAMLLSVLALNSAYKVRQADGKTGDSGYLVSVTPYECPSPFAKIPGETLEEAQAALRLVYKNLSDNEAQDFKSVHSSYFRSLK